MVSDNNDITLSESPQERFKQMVEEVITEALWDFGLRQNDFDYQSNGLRKKAIQKDVKFHYQAKTDFLGHDKIILDDIKLLTKATSSLKAAKSFLLDRQTVSGFNNPEKIEALIQSILQACKDILEKKTEENTRNFDNVRNRKSLKFLKGVNKLEDPQNFCNAYIKWDLMYFIYTSHTNAHTINSIPENAYDIVEGHLTDAIRKYFGVEVQASLDVAPIEKFSASLDAEAAKEKWQTEKSGLESAKSHQFQRLVVFGMVAAEEFRAAAQEIGSWQSKRIAELPPSIKHSIAMCDIMRDYKTLEPDERAQVASQMIREIGHLQSSIKRDVTTIAADCETTDEAVDILAAHKQNMQRYAQGIKTEEQRLSELFGSAAVGEKVVELEQIVANTGIQVAQQTAIHQSYNTATLKQISQLSGKMDQLAGSVTRLSIAIKLRDMLSEGGIVGDIARSTLDNIDLHANQLKDFQSMNAADLDDIIEAEAVHIQTEIEPIATKGHEIEQRIIEGKAADQFYLAAPELPENEAEGIEHG